MSTVISHVLLDIEGTTCPVSYVSGTLFPYASRELGPFLERNQQDTRIQELVETVERSWQQDPQPEAQQLWNNTEQQRIQNGEELVGAGTDDVSLPKHKLIVPYLQWLIRVDRKYTPLKELQGMVWNEGYSRGELKSTLFTDVPDTLQHWRDQGLVLGVYSSGSVPAQKLLYEHSQAGDLRALFQHWFDTHVGGKHEAESYRRICVAMQVDPQQVLFISDCKAELEAAARANLQVILCDRNTPEMESYDRNRSDTIPPNRRNLRTVHNLTQVNLQQIQP